MQATAKAATFDRRAVAAKAAEARGKGKRKRAVELYREILEHDPEDHEVHGKIAQLLAEGGDLTAASVSFRAGAEGYHKKGFTDRAIALLKQGTTYLPTDAELWLRISEMYVGREKKKDAEKTLSDARPMFKRKADLRGAARILDAHLALEPRALDVAIDRAQVAKRLRDRDHGVALLTGLLAGASDAERKKLRKALFSLQPSLGSWWRWVRNARMQPDVA